MGGRDDRQRQRRTASAALAVLMVLGTVTVVCLIGLLLGDVLLDRFPFILFLAAVAASTRYAGWPGGVAALLLSLGAGAYLFAAPRFAVWIGNLDHAIAALIFVGVSLGLIAMMAAEQRARRDVERRDAQLREEHARRAALERELEEARRLEGLGRLAGGVAHDFNNLLTVVLGSAELLRRRRGGDALLDGIQHAAERGADLTRQLLRFARSQAMQLRPMTLNDAVDEAVRLAERLVSEDVRFAVDLHPDPWPFDGDPAQVQQVLMNLITNARDALPRGGEIAITTDNVTLDAMFARRHREVTPGEYVRLRVSDNGIGMEEEQRRRIFEPFFTTKAMGRGTGLGLAVTYGIIKQLRGYVSVASEPGHGTTVEIHWPRARVGPAELPPAPGPGRSMPADAAMSELTVLLVEDDERVRELAAELVRGLGHRVLVAENGAAALQLARVHPDPIDVLLTDVVMPWMNGGELADRLQRLRPGLHVVFMSGYTDNVVLQKGALKPGVVLVSKPFTAEDLDAAIRRVLRQTRAAG